MTAQTSTSRENRNNQKSLAETLIACLGFEGALHACQANTWDGVLVHVMAHKCVTA